MAQLIEFMTALLAMILLASCEHTQPIRGSLHPSLQDAPNVDAGVVDTKPHANPASNTPGQEALPPAREHDPTGSTPFRSAGPEPTPPTPSSSAPNEEAANDLGDTNALREQLRRINDRLIAHEHLSQPSPPPPPRPSNTSGTSVVASVLFLILGALISLYGTLVFDRYKRFGELLREVGRARQHFEGYPTSIQAAELTTSHTEAVKFWRLLEANEWALQADGHQDAAAELGRLKSFVYRAVACIENMQSGKTKGLKLDQYLSAFQLEYSQLKKNFIQFEAGLRPSVWALLQPLPHSVLPKKAKVISVDYFDKLL